MFRKWTLLLYLAVGSAFAADWVAFHDLCGNTHNVWTGSNSGYWMDGRGNDLNSDLSPGPGWQRLTPKE